MKIDSHSELSKGLATNIGIIGSCERYGRPVPQNPKSMVAKIQEARREYCKTISGSAI